MHDFAGVLEFYGFYCSMDLCCLAFMVFRALSCL